MNWTGKGDPVLTPFIRLQLVFFAILTVTALAVLGLYYVRLPTVAGVGQYKLYADLPASGGLYRTANVTYRGIQIGKVTDVQPTERGARATMSIDDRYKIPVNAVANVHSVSAVGEQYLDLVSAGPPTQGVTQYFASGQTITKGTVPDEVGPALDTAYRGLAALPKDRIDSLLSEASQAVGGLGPSLQRLVDSTSNIAQDFRDNIGPVTDVIQHSGPVLNSQVQSGDAIEQWAANLNVVGAQTAAQDPALRSLLQQAAPTADQLNSVFSGVQDSLPQTLANLEIVIDMLKRYHKGVEQALVYFPQEGSLLEAGSIWPGEGIIDFALGPIFAAIGASLAITPVGLLAIPPGAGTDINLPPPCFTGFLPASEWRSPADTSMKDPPSGTYCKIPKDFQGNVVRGARNFPCLDVPGKRAATPTECHSNEPYVPLGTNPWYGDPNQVLNCPAPAARCDQPVDPGRVIPAPSVNNGMNPLPANLLPPSGTPPPVSDALSPPGQGTVTCNGQQPNPCIYTPSGPVAIYNPQSGDVMTPDGSRFSIKDSTNTGDDGWKEMLAPSG